MQLTTTRPVSAPAPAPAGAAPAERQPTLVTTPDGRALGTPSSVNSFPTEPVDARTTDVSLAEAGIDAVEYARFTNVTASGDVWQVVGTPYRDSAVPLAGSFRDAVRATRELAVPIGRSWADPAYAIVAGADGTRHAVQLRGYLKPDKLLGEDNVREVFVSEVRPEVEALVSHGRWIDLRRDEPGTVHAPRRLVSLPFYGPVVPDGD